VSQGDWCEVTLAMTKKYGETFAALNMANAFYPGGGYARGMVAQEENMFRRTDCHFSLHPTMMDSTEEYTAEHTALIEAREGRVYLDTQCPRVCVRGAEDRGRPDLGYMWLEDDDIFPFYELRAAAVDLRGGKGFNEEEMARRVRAQLDTLADAGVRHAVLSAFGCGAFMNPAPAIAAVYKAELQRRATDFDVVAFAIYHAGYGPNNYAPFEAVFKDWPLFAGDSTAKRGKKLSVASPNAQRSCLGYASAQPPPRPQKQGRSHL